MDAFNWEGEDWLPDVLEDQMTHSHMFSGPDPIIIEIPFDFEFKYFDGHIRASGRATFAQGPKWFRWEKVVAVTERERCGWPWFEYWFQQILLWGKVHQVLPNHVCFGRDGGVAVNRWLYCQVIRHLPTLWKMKGEVIGGYAEAEAVMTETNGRWEDWPEEWKPVLPVIDF